MKSEQTRQREENLRGLEALGLGANAYSYDPSHHSKAVLDDFDALEQDGAEVRVAGRIMSLRSHGKSTFVHLQDKEGRIQAYFKLSNVGEDSYQGVKLLDVGDHLGISGTVFRTRTGEITIQAKAWVLLAKCLHPLPEKWHGLKDVEMRYRQRYLDLIVTEETQKIFRTRTALISALREYLDGKDYLEVETPILQPLYGGAFARPFITWHEALDMKLFLRISNELYLKRLIVGGMERVYEIARDFRNEGIDRNHNPEFTMLEFYEAYADYEKMLDTTEEIISQAIHKATGSYRVTFGDLDLDFTPPWNRISYFDAIREATGIDLLGADEPALRAAAGKLNIDLAGKTGIGQIIDQIFGETAEANIVQPTFVTDFPLEISPLARRNRKDDRLVERFEVFVARMELANAFSEQNNPVEQEAAFDRQAILREGGDEEAQLKDLDYLRALQLGMPPTGGVGIGVDRLVMLATGATNIREVILFPQLRHQQPEAAAPVDAQEPSEV